MDILDGVSPVWFACSWVLFLSCVISYNFIDPIVVDPPTILVINLRRPPNPGSIFGLQLNPCMSP